MYASLQFAARVSVKTSFTTVNVASIGQICHAGDGLSAGAGLGAASLLLLLHVPQLMKGFACICCACEERKHRHLNTLLSNGVNGRSKIYSCTW